MIDASILLYPIYGGVLMRSKRIPAEEQYRLIMECRQSGLTDHQWCVEHDIKPGRCEHFTLSDLWRCAHEKQKNTCRRTIPSHHGMPSKWIDRSSMVCGTRHQTGNFVQLGKKAASERLCGFANTVSSWNAVKVD